MKAFLNSTRFRLILLVLMAVIPALGLTLFTGLEVRQQATEKVQIDAKRMVKISVDSYNDLIASGQQLLTGLAQLPQVRQQDAAGCNPLFASMLKEFPEYTNLAVSDLQGNIFCSGRALTTPVNIADRNYFQQVMKTAQFSISNYEIGRETQKSTVVMAHPSLDAAGHVKSIVMASLDLVVLGQTITIAQLPENSVFFIIDSDGTVLVRSPQPQQWVGKNMAGIDIVQDILRIKAEGTAEATGMDNINRLYAFQPVQDGPNNRAYMAIGIPLANVYTEANHLLNRSLILLGVVAILALTSAWIMGDILVYRQIKPLLYAAERWTAGDLHTRIVQKKGTAEFLHLSDAFNRMAEAITQREEQIRQAERIAVESATRIKIQSAILEQREKERTKIARDLHDGPMQEITGVTYAIQDMLTSNCSPEMVEKLEELQAVLKDQIQELRSYAGELRPPSLTKFGLGKAMHSHLAIFQHRHPEFHVLFEETAEGGALPEAMQVGLFRIYQELLNNIFKHAQATEICIQLVQTERQVLFEIRDNGIGFSVTTDWLELARQGHLGLVGIKERAEAIGGNVQIHSAPGNGTVIRVVVPRNNIRTSPTT